MRVAVTGSSGKIGRAAAAALRAAGHRIVGFDLAAGDIGGVRTVRVDCTDFGEVMGALSGADMVGGGFDAVVHLAGIPAPGLASDATIMASNSLSTYNIFSASARLGIMRIVWASSETLLGLPFTSPPAYVPLDEDAPALPNSSYALSKLTGETMADQFVRWHPGFSIVSLRFSNVYEASDYAQRAAIVARPDWRRLNLWGYVDARDCGEACRLAVEAAVTGHERLIIAAVDNLVGLPSADLMAAHFPGVPVKGGLEGDASLLSSDRARRLIGYAPRHGWKTMA